MIRTSTAEAPDASTFSGLIHLDDLRAEVEQPGHPQQDLAQRALVDRRRAPIPRSSRAPFSSFTISLAWSAVQRMEPDGGIGEQVDEHAAGAAHDEVSEDQIERMETHASNITHHRAPFVKEPGPGQTG